MKKLVVSLLFLLSLLCFFAACDITAPNEEPQDTSAQETTAQETSNQDDPNECAHVWSIQTTYPTCGASKQRIPPVPRSDTT